MQMQIFVVHSLFCILSVEVQSSPIFSMVNWMESDAETESPPTTTMVPKEFQPDLPSSGAKPDCRYTQQFRKKDFLQNYCITFCKQRTFHFSFETI